MSLTLAANPDKDVLGVLSNVNGAITQLPYTFSRQDYATGNITDSGGRVQLDVNTVTATENTAGNVVYWAAPFSIYKPGIYTVFSSDIGQQKVVLDTPYISDSTSSGWINNLTTRPDYSVRIRFFSGADQILEPTFVYVTSQAGRLFTDLGSIIVSYMENQLIKEINYHIEYAEFYGGVEQPATTDVNIFALLGERSIGFPGGSNYAGHLPNLAPLGIPLTRFNPLVRRVWRGFLRYHHWLFDSRAVARTGTLNNELRTIQVGRDVNQVTIGTIINTPTTAAGFVISNIVNDDPGKLYYYNEIDVRDNLSTIPVVASQLFKYEDPCPNPIYVEWIDSFGVAEHWLFSISQDVTLGATTGLIYEIPVDDDVENINRAAYRLSSDETLQVTCIAEGLTNDEIRGLHEIKTSETVEVFLTADGSIRVGVIVSSGFTTTYATDDNNGTFQVTLEFPTDYKFFKKIQY